MVFICEKMSEVGFWPARGLRHFFVVVGDERVWSCCWSSVVRGGVWGEDDDDGHEVMALLALLALVVSSGFGGKLIEEEEESLSRLVLMRSALGRENKSRSKDGLLGSSVSKMSEFVSVEAELDDASGKIKEMITWVNCIVHLTCLRSKSLSFDQMLTLRLISLWWLEV